MPPRSVTAAPGALVTGSPAPLANSAIAPRVPMLQLASGSSRYSSTSRSTVSPTMIRGCHPHDRSGKGGASPGDVPAPVEGSGAGRHQHRLLDPAPDRAGQRRLAVHLDEAERV